MDVTAIRDFFMWCTIVNGSLLVLSFLFCSCSGDWVYRMQSRWLPVSREAFDVAIYCFTGLFKMFVLAFNLVPYIALVIIG